MPIKRLEGRLLTREMSASDRHAVEGLLHILSIHQTRWIACLLQLVTTVVTGIRQSCMVQNAVRARTGVPISFIQSDPDRILSAVQIIYLGGNQNSFLETGRAKYSIQT